ncbi:MAG TPA: penicillin-binding protein 1C [Bacteroidota bacterium]|nr:penicillin-binding protein 1C [Bacteroidota bacterium]
MARRLFHGRAILVLLLLAGVVVATLDMLFPPPAPPPWSAQVFARDGQLLSAFLSSDDKWRLRTRLDAVTPELIEAMVEKEDRWFLYHPGVNPVAVLRALWSNLVQGRRVSGASTITMQVARLLEKRPRTYGSKFFEMLRAVQLERRYPKARILEMYLSLLPMGGNIEGVTSAAYLYFNRPPDKLSLAQCIALALIPNNPNRLRLDRDESRVNALKNVWVRRFSDRGLFRRDLLASARDEYLERARHAMPTRAPHLSRLLPALSGSDITVSTIDPALQATAEGILRDYVQRVMLEGVGNGAVFIVRNDSMDVVAYCASADFDDALHQGQVNGITAPRSPGSTLKPFLYARAFDDGSLTPEMRLLDIPTDFGGYMPENFDDSFRGEVTVREALLQSLNIPAVRLLARQGVPDFVTFLSSLGFTGIERAREKLGLSLILGGCGVSLEQLTRASTMFAREGRIAPLRYLLNAPLNEGQRAMSPGAAWLVSEILSKHQRADVPPEFLASTRLPRISWKTGTSYGKRDAWAVGWNARYTVGVWMGNFNGQGAPTLSGAVMAVPLLVDVFNAIDYNSGQAWLKRPSTVRQRSVCARSGMPPSAECEHLSTDFAIEHVSTSARCSLLREYHVDAARSMHYCMDCLPAEGAEVVRYPVYDPELQVWFQQNNVDVPQPPPHNPRCTARPGGEAPVIISPLAAYEYYVEKGSAQQIALQAAAAPGVRVLHWYVDGEALGDSAPGGKLFFTPQRGTHRIICLDDAGRKSTVELRVKYY